MARMKTRVQLNLADKIARLGIFTEGESAHLWADEQQHLASLAKRLLSPHEYYVLCRYYGLGGAERYSTKDLATSLDISYEQAEYQVTLATQGLLRCLANPRLYSPRKSVETVPTITEVVKPTFDLPVLLKKISMLKLSKATRTSLERTNIRLVGELVQCARVSLLQVPGFDELQLREVEKKLSSLNLKLNTWLPDDVQDTIDHHRALMEGQ